MDRGRRTIKLYSLIYFKCRDGYLAASGLVGERLFLRAPSVVGDTTDEVLPFFGFADSCVFRVVPTLSSRAAASSVKDASGADRPHTRNRLRSGSNGVSSTVSDIKAEDLFYDPRSAASIIDVEEITYGKSFSLVHEASGLFLSVAHELPSENDPDCLSVVLVRPSAAQTPSCELTLVSRYKMHADGDKLCLTDSVLIRLTGNPMYLHVSALPIMEEYADNPAGIELLRRTFRLGSTMPCKKRSTSVLSAYAATGGARASSVVGVSSSPTFRGWLAAHAAGDAAMAQGRCNNEIAVEALTREYLDEVNACEEGGVTFTVHRYDMGTDRANLQRTQLRITLPYIACGVPVTLFHRQRESFLMISTTQNSQFSDPAAVGHEGADTAEANADTMTSETAASPAAERTSTTATHAESVWVPGVGAESSARHHSIAGLPDVDRECTPGAAVVVTAKRRSSPASVEALRGAAGAIYKTSSFGRATSQASLRTPLTTVNRSASAHYENCSMFTNNTQPQQERHQMEQALRDEGLIDVGNGRHLPFPVFASTSHDGSGVPTVKADMSTAESHRHCTTLWCFEHEDPSLGGPLRLGDSWCYRLRHVISGMYVSVCGTAVDAMLADLSDDDGASSDHGAVQEVWKQGVSGVMRAGTSSRSSDSSEESYSSSSSEESTPRVLRSRRATAVSIAATDWLNNRAPGGIAASTRETRLCLIPPPRTRRELIATLFCVESMYATDSTYLIEQSCLCLKNALTDMYVVTLASVEGSNVSLSLDSQMSMVDSISVSYVPHQLQLDARFIAGQCAWLARYRAQMQALVRQKRQVRAELEAAALKGNPEAAARLEAETQSRDSLPARIKSLYNTPDPDSELLKRRDGFLGPRAPLASPSRGPKVRTSLSTVCTSMSTGNCSAAAEQRGDSIDCWGVRGGTDEVPSYASMRNTIRLCQRALIVLIEFCTESEETNVLQREGLPIVSRQSLLHEVRFHRLLFDVLRAPFELLDSAEAYGPDARRAATSNNLAAVMTADYDTFGEVFEKLSLAQHQQAEMGCLWSGMWRSRSNSGGGALSHAELATNTLDVKGDRRSRRADVGGGVMEVKEVMLPIHRELHLLMRLTLRLLRQMIKGNAATFARDWSAYIPVLLHMDGLRLHVVDTMQELFTDNPYIPLRAVRQVLEHFINVSQEIRSSAYMNFLGAACTIKYKGVPERQAFVCQRLLVENPHSLCRFAVVVRPGEVEGAVYISPHQSAGAVTDRETERGEAAPRRGVGPDPGGGDGVPRCMTGSSVGVVLSSPPEGYIPFADFFTGWKDKRQVSFVKNQIALFARLCYDGCPEQCRRVVRQHFPAVALRNVLETFVWTGEQAVGRISMHDELRSHLIRLALQCFILPRISAPAVQLRVSTVLFGSSQLRQRGRTYSGLPDDEMTQTLKRVVMHLFRANPFFVQDDIGRSVLMRSAVSMWLKLIRYRQYSHGEVLELLPVLMQLLDGTQDVLECRLLNKANRPEAKGSLMRSASQLTASFSECITAQSTSNPIGAGGTTVSDRSGSSRLVHKVESLHIMRIREMICEALALALQQEIFRAADGVIVYLYETYVDDRREGQLSSLSSRSPAAVDLQTMRRRLRETVLDQESDEGGGGVAEMTEKSPLLARRRRDVNVLQDGTGTTLAAQRDRGGYHDLQDRVVSLDAPVGDSADFSFSRQRPQVPSTSSSSPWMSKLLHTQASSPPAALSSAWPREEVVSDDGDAGAARVSLESYVEGAGRSVEGNSCSLASAHGATAAKVLAADVQAYVDYHTSCIVEYFQPTLLVPRLFDLTRYDCPALTVQAMNLLVQLCVVKRSIAQLVLKVNTLPSVEVLRSFDRICDVAVQLREAFECVSRDKAYALQWEAPVQAALDTLNGPSPLVAVASEDAPCDVAGEEAGVPASGTGENLQSSSPRVVSTRATHLRERRASLFSCSSGGVLHEWFFSEDEESGDQSDENEGQQAGLEASCGAAQEGSAAMSDSMRLRRRRQRINRLWSSTSAAVSMLAYKRTIRNRRRALGLSETSAIPMSTIIRAEMMAHWRVHESLLQMLPYLTPSDPAFNTVLQFFYLFTFSESNSSLLQPFVKLFIEKVDTCDHMATVCLHIIVRVLRTDPHVEDYLTPNLLVALVGHVSGELSAKIPDPELIDMLSQYIFSKSVVSPVVRRRMMMLFREHGTLASLARARLNTTLPSVVFMSSLVNLVCSICGSHTTVLTLARSMLPAENICSVILQKRILESLPSVLMKALHRGHGEKGTEDGSMKQSPVAPLKLLNPYVRLLVALYFIPKNDSADASRRRCLQWVGSKQFWCIARLFTSALNTLSDAVERGGSVRAVSRGLAAVRAHRSLTCTTIPVAIAAYFLNCFSTDGYTRFQKDVIGNAFSELAASFARFGGILMKHMAALQLTAEEVVNHRRALGILEYRLTHLNDNDVPSLDALAESCGDTKERMRLWLARQQCEPGTPATNIHAAAVKATGKKPKQKKKVDAETGGGARGDAGSLRAPACATRASSGAATRALLQQIQYGGRSECGSDDEVCAYRVLFSDEAVSQAQLRLQETLEAAGVGSPTQQGADGTAGDTFGEFKEEVDIYGLNGLGLLLPGVLARDRGVSAVRASLRSVLCSDTLIPTIKEFPSEVAMIAMQQLLRCTFDEDMQRSVACNLEAMRENLFRPVTFVGLLNLFSNALDAALHYPKLVSALLEGGVGSANAASKCRTGVAQTSAKDGPFPVFLGARVPDAPAGGPEDSNLRRDAAWRRWDSDAAVSLEDFGLALQTTFDDTGMLSVVISLCGLEEDVISLNAMRLGVLILEGGNRRAQNRLIDYFLTRNESFFHDIRDILRKNLRWVERMNAEHQFCLMKRGMLIGHSRSAVAAANIQLVNALILAQRPMPSGQGLDVDREFFFSHTSVTSLGEDHQPLWTAAAAGGVTQQVSGWGRVRGSRRLKLIIYLFRLLQLFCEGHHSGLQNYVRAQHDNLHSANIIHETMIFLEEMSAFVTPSNFGVILQGFDFLTEACQGPCRLNQQSLIEYGACRVIRHVVEYLQEESASWQTAYNTGSITGGDPSFLRVAAGGSPAFTRGCGRVGQDFWNALPPDDADRLRVAVSSTLLALLEGCREAEAYRRILRQIPLTTVALEVQYALHPSTLHYIHHDQDTFETSDRVEAMFNWVIYLWSVQPYAALEGVAAGVESLLRSAQSVSRYLGSIEVLRADGLERVYFRIPAICSSLTRERKNELLWAVDRTSRTTKLADFLHKCDEIIFAVEWSHAFHRKLRSCTQFSIPYYDETIGGRPSIAQRCTRFLKGFHNSYIAGVLIPYELVWYDRASMVLAVAVNTILIAMEGGNDTSKATVKKGFLVMQVLCIFQTLVCVYLCVVYVAVLFPVRLYSVYKNKQRFAAGRVQLNVKLEEAYAGLTARERLSSFLTWYEMHFRLLMCVFAILSCTVSDYFAAFNLMLVVYSIPALRTFISAITMNGRQLLLTSLMGIIMLYLFSIVGYLVFADQYDANSDGSGHAGAASSTNCETLLRCFMYIMDQGLRAGGGVGDVMRPWRWGNRRMLVRLAYDMLFYALVTVVFLNVLFGIIIDTFGQMRDEKREKEMDMHGLCFICGLDFDTLEKSGGAGFAGHVTSEHNMWMYLYFIHHLRRKDPSEYTGQESYVSWHIEHGSLGFFPEGDCISLMCREDGSQTQATALGEDDDGDVDTRINAEDTARAVARGAMKDLTVARDTVNNYLKEWQSDSLRLKALIQQLELTARGIGAAHLDDGVTLPASKSCNDDVSSVSSRYRSLRTDTPTARSRHYPETSPLLDSAPVSRVNSMHATVPFLGASFSSASTHSCPLVVVDGGSSSSADSDHRSLRAQLEKERQMRQLSEQERRRLKCLLRERDEMVKRMSRRL